MTEAAVAIARNESALATGEDLSREILEKLGGRNPHALLVFASSSYDYAELLESIHSGCSPAVLVGCSSAGEFTATERMEGAVCAIAIISDKIKFSAGLAQNLSKDKKLAANEMVSTFIGLKSHQYRYHTAIVMADALAGHTDDFIQELTLATDGKYQFAGGGAGDDAKFRDTDVFIGRKAYKNAAVALEIISNEPIGIGVQHGWRPGSEAMRVTEAHDSTVVSINSVSAVEAFMDFARQTKQNFDPADPIPFFLHNVIGLKTSSGYKLRVPLTVNEDGSISCASTVPEGSTIFIMRTDQSSAIQAAASSAETALAQLNGREPKVALFFDCVATRLRMGIEFGGELSAVGRSLKGAEFAGCNTYGQIARVDGQFSGFHNCTAVTCILP